MRLYGKVATSERKRKTKSKAKRRPGMATTARHAVATGHVEKTSSGQPVSKLWWLVPLVLSAVFDAIGSGYFDWLKVEAPWRVNIYTRSVLWTLTGALFLTAQRNGMSRGKGYALFGILITFTNMAAGFIRGQFPTKPILAGAGFGVGVFTFVKGSKTDDDEVERKPKLANQLLLYLISIGSIYAGLKTGNWIVWLLPYALWDYAATPMSTMLEGRVNNGLLKFVIRAITFIPLSFVFSHVLDLTESLAVASVASGMVSAMVAPLLDSFVYGASKENFLEALRVAFWGGISILLMKAAY